MMQFPTTFRGYDRTEVDSFVEKTTEALESDDPARTAQARAAADAVEFHVTLRGYNRESVDQYLRRIARGRL